MAKSKNSKTQGLILMKYVFPNNSLWYWCDADSLKILSPFFESQKDAQDWLDDLKDADTECRKLLNRIQYGQFFIVQARVLDASSFSSFPFHYILDEFVESTGEVIISIEVLATSKKDAQERILAASNNIQIIEE